MHFTKSFFTVAFVLLIFFITGCGAAGNSLPPTSGNNNEPSPSVDNPTDDPTDNPTLSSAKVLTSYSILGNAGVINEAAKTVAVKVPHGTDVASLVATFVTTGVSVAVGGVQQTSGVTKNDFSSPLEYVVAASDGTTARYTVTVTSAKSDSKELTSFSLMGVAGTINEAAKTVTIELPFGTDVTSLVATFGTTGVSVKVGGVEQVSGVTPNDYSTMVDYVVAAADGTTASYVVAVMLASSDSKEITSFSITGVPGVIDELAKTITVQLPIGTDASALVASFTTSGTGVEVEGVVQQSGVTANNFLAPVRYVVVAEDNSSVEYTVTVVVATSSSKAITSYSILGVVGTINESGKTITVALPYGTNLTALVATFSTTAALVQVGGVAQASGATPNNFTSPVAYLLTAADGSSTQYTVTIVANAIAPTLSYSSSSGTIGTVGSAMSVAPSTLNANGEPITACGIKSGTTALPAYLTVNSTTCVISGTPTSTLSATVFTLVATNSAGTSANATVTLRVNAAPPTLSYSSSSGTIGTVGSAMSVTPSTLKANGATVTVCGIKNGTTALPSYLTVNATTCVISGIPTSSLSATLYTLVATNSAGTSANATVVLNVVNSHTVGGTILGLSPDDGVIIKNNGGDEISVSENGSFVFPSKIASGSAYSVVVVEEPYLKQCSVSNGSGVVPDGNVTDVRIVCISPGITPAGADWENLVTASIYNDSYFRSVAVGADGSIYAVGHIEGAGPFDYGNGVTITGYYDWDVRMVVVKYNASGAAQWAKAVATGSYIGDYYGVAVAPDGSIYAVGTIGGRDTYDFGDGVTVKTVSLDDWVDTNVVIVKYSAAGVAQWARSVTTNYPRSHYDGVSVGSDGSIYAVGYIQGGGELGYVFDFGNGVTASGDSDGSGGSSVVIVKYNSSGVAQWARSATNTNITPYASDSFFTGVAVDGADSIYAVGTIYDNALFNFGNGVTASGAQNCVHSLVMVKYDSNGVAQWARAAAGGYVSSFRGVSVGTNDSIYAVGNVEGTYTYDFGNGVTVAGEHANGTTPIILRYNKAGEVRWARAATTYGWDKTSQYCGVAARKSSGVYAARNGARIDAYDTSGIERWTEHLPNIQGNWDFCGGIAVGASGSIAAASEAHMVNYVTGTVGRYSSGVFAIGGAVDGLDIGDTIVLQNSGDDDLTLEADGEFVFSMGVLGGQEYSTNISITPAGKTCTVSNGVGSPSLTNVSNISVVCDVDAYSVRGSVSGLGVGEEVIIVNNNADQLVIDADEAFVFATKVADGGRYEVVVSSSPEQKTCSISNGAGTISGADVTDVSIVCSVDSYDVRGSVAGLDAGEEIVLLNNNADPLIVNDDGDFMFWTTVADGSGYEVVVPKLSDYVLNPPYHKTCTVSNGTGTVAGADVVNVSVSCLPPAWPKSEHAGSGYSEFLSIATAADGSIYAVGDINGVGSYDFGNGVTVTSVSGSFSTYNTVIVKYDATGTAQWAKSVSSSERMSYFNGVSVAPDGSIYAVGTIAGNGEYDFGDGVTASCTDCTDEYAGQIIIVKYSTDGHTQWAKSVTKSPNSYFFGVSVGPDGSIYAVGRIYGQDVSDFGNGITVNFIQLHTNLVIVKYDSDGDAQWAKSVPVGQNSQFSGVSVSADGSIYASGVIYGTNPYDFGDGVTASGSSGNSNAVIVKYSADGHAQWARSIAVGSDYSSFSAVSAHADDGIYAVGYIQGTGVFDFGNGITAQGPYASGQNTVIVKYDSAGVPQWANSVATGTNNSNFRGVDVDAAGDIYVVGSIQGTGGYYYGNGETVNGSYAGNNVTIVKYNAIGTAQWARSVTTGSNNSGFNGVSVAPDDSIYAVGSIYGNGEYDFGDDEVVSGASSQNNVVIMKYSSE